MSRNTNIQETRIGLFWESDNQRGIVDILALSDVLTEITKSLSTMNHIDKACVLACTLHPQEQQYLHDNGFEVKTNHNSVFERLSLLHEIFLWLWDIERTRKSYAVKLVLITKNMDYIPFLREFQKRGVSITCISDFITASGVHVRDEVSIVCTKVIEQSVLIHHVNRWIHGEYINSKDVAKLFIKPYNVYPQHEDHYIVERDSTILPEYSHSSNTILRGVNSDVSKESWLEHTGTNSNTESIIHEKDYIDEGLDLSSHSNFHYSDQIGYIDSSSISETHRHIGLPTTQSPIDNIHHTNEKIMKNYRVNNNYQSTNNNINNNNNSNNNHNNNININLQQHPHTQHQQRHQSHITSVQSPATTIQSSSSSRVNYGTNIHSISHSNPHLSQHISLNNDDISDISSQFLSPNSDFNIIPSQSNTYHNYNDQITRDCDDINFQGPPENQTYFENNYTSEQLQLQEDLMTSVYAYNVKSAVSTLRKMYTKQSRNYRIPVILGHILPDTNAMISNGRIDLLNIALCFLLDCIQWCFGVQKGENIESFKYKMNANIARWILREGTKKGIPPSPSHVVQNTTLNVMNQILENYVELSFIYEMLQSFNISQPIQRLIPYMIAWLGSSSTSIQGRVHDFLYDHPECAPFLPSNLLNNNNNNSSYSQQGGIGLNREEGYSNDPNSMAVGQTYRYDAVDQALELKLLKLLARSQKGELGARIPALFREEYGEPLRLRGRKLKDILIDSGKVDMYGIDGPGDKLFRIKPSLGTLNFNFPNETTLTSELSTQNYGKEDEINNDFYSQSNNQLYLPSNLTTESNIINDDSHQHNSSTLLDYNHLFSPYIRDESSDVQHSYQYSDVESEHQHIHNLRPYVRRDGIFPTDENYLYAQNDAGFRE